VPGSTGGELLSGDEPVAQPLVEGVAAGAEDLLGLADRDHEDIFAAGCDIGGFWLVNGYVVLEAEAGDAGAGPGQAGGVRRCWRARIAAMVVSS